MDQLRDRAAKLGRICILTGGISAERDVALASGKNVFATLKDYTEQVELFDLNRTTVTDLCKRKIDIAFLAIHGTWAEDGAIQGLLEWLNIPYTGSGISASALAMDKYKTKLLWQAMHLPTPAFQLIKSVEEAKQTDLPLPLAIKPICEGSSLGISKVTHKEQLAQAWQQARQYTNQVLAECWIEGDEFTVALLGGKILPIIKLEPQAGFYDYAAKYQRSDTQYIFDHGLAADKIREANVITLAACAALGIQDFARVDLILDAQGQFQLLEVNTLPGMTAHSLLPKAAQQAGIEPAELIITMLELGKKGRKY